VDAITEPAQDAIAPVVELVEPVMEAATSATEAVAPVVDAILPSGDGTLLGVEVSGQEPIVTASGSLDFPGATLNAAADADELFSADNYTDYSITLTTQTSGETSETSVTGPAVTSSLLDQVLGDATDLPVVSDVPDEQPVVLPTATVPNVFQGFGWHI
jgi:hypothetical protein